MERPSLTIHALLKLLQNQYIKKIILNKTMSGALNSK